ncbi:MAG: type II secretion system F family protein [Actinobacteria bacterium]|nr:type II secretion system F family protein [Actinomycetota bacterium]
MSDPVLIAGSASLCGAFAALARAATTAERALGPLVRIERPREGARIAAPRIRAITVVIVGAALGAVVAGPAGAVVAAGGSVGARALARRRRAKRRADLLEAELADAVAAIAAALRAGLSLSQSVAYAAGEAEEPLAETLARVVRLESLGEPLEAGLERWAQEVGGEDARLVTGVLALHRRTGGDLPRVLDRVGEALRERRASAREVRALTAQARLSGAILGALPIAFFLFLLVTSRRDVAGAFETGTGVAAIGLGLVMEGAAFVWIRRLLRVA